ncbi:DUF2243 domain-containing protein [Salinicoccus roseus]|uniref:DUF2243 domain-containing protein n=1 Tax=Salinicoccus roseus TaxID=45670 RepID=UPI000F502A7D|nr:DUF2243 domain-containing protein [Salinicoccus roseus]RPE50932.1 putative membrane protein [Salinicoccus roseus]GGA79361.1 membrane protein [Salinicoccus roseus]
MARKQEISHAKPAMNIWSGVLFGIGLMALIDEIIFHQLLQWHHFYDLFTPFIGILSDGLLNAFALFALVAGLFMFADIQRRHIAHMRTWTASLFLGLGGFQVFDGIVNHKLLQIHQVRYGVEILPYDLAWNISGLMLLIIGTVLFTQARKHMKPSEAR